jgi:hypothetical protein
MPACFLDQRSLRLSGLASTRRSRDQVGTGWLNGPSPVVEPSVTYPGRRDLGTVWSMGMSDTYWYVAFRIMPRIWIFPSAVYRRQLAARVTVPCDANSEIAPGTRPPSSCCLLYPRNRGHSYAIPAKSRSQSPSLEEETR